MVDLPPSSGSEEDFFSRLGTSNFELPKAKVLGRL
jgi:hypothetical protein